ncbi:MAG: peroxiredoxin family protein [Deltaproteobacteria bacterium]|nr:peroxiredoxin family protein [Deltaproteobacteria bacterium]
MAEIRKRFDSFRKYNTDVFALSVDTPKQSRAVIREMKLPFQLLCDVDKEVIDLYHLRNSHEHGGIAYPAMFVIRPSGKIHYRSLDTTAHRIDMSYLIEFLETMNKDPEYLPTAKPRKRWIIPFPKVAWQISRNMIFRGNFADWKHYVTFPYAITKLSWKKLTGSKV